MPQQNLIIATFAAYLLVVFILAYIAWRRTANLSDFILGGRSLNSFVTALAAQASDMSGWLLLGLPGLAYAAGLESLWLVAGLLAGTYLNWKLVAEKLRTATEKLGDALTLPDYFERRFNDSSHLLRLVSGGFILVFFTLYTSSGFVAAGKLFESLFGMPYRLALVAGALSVIVYTFIGGFLAVSWADVLQGMLMFLALVLVAALGWHLGGGATGIEQALITSHPELLNPMTDVTGSPLGFIGIASLAGWGLGYAGQPHILARFMAIRHAAGIAAARRTAMVWVSVVLVAAVIVGLTGTMALDRPLNGADSEKVFIYMAVDYFPPILAGIALSGILAAVMSTASAQLLVSSSAFAEDFYRGLFRHNAGRRELLWTARGAVLAVALAALYLARNPESKVLDLVAWAWAGFGSAFAPVILLSLYWPKMNRAGAFAGIVTGGITALVWNNLSGGWFDLYEIIPGFVFSLLAIIAATYISRARSK